MTPSQSAPSARQPQKPGLPPAKPLVPPGGKRIALPPLVLSAKRSTWRLADDEHLSADINYQRVRPKVLQRDNHTCRYCGFRATKWQEVHHLNDDHADNRLENLITICSLCHMTFHIGRTGAAISGEAILLWYPEISQAMLNHVSRAIYVALHFGNDDIKSVVRAVQAAFQERSSILAENFGTSDGTVLGEALLRLSDAEYRQRAEKLKHVRLFPMGRKLCGGMDRWPDMLRFWVSKEGPFGGLPIDSWTSLYDALKPPAVS